MGKGQKSRQNPRSRGSEKKKDNGTGFDISAFSIDKYKVFVVVVGRWIS